MRYGSKQSATFLVIGTVALLFAVTFLLNRLDFYAQATVWSGQSLATSRNFFSNVSLLSDVSTNNQTKHIQNSLDVLSSIKVLCFVETCSKNLATKAKAVQETWAKRCDKTLFISDEANPSFPTLVIPGVLPGHERLWSKTSLTMVKLYEDYKDQFHWFFKADDDTFVIVENLKVFLALHDPNEPHFFGKRFKTFNGYNSGGAGYVLSREALVRLGKALKSQNSPCAPLDSKTPEDVAMGKCLATVAVKPGRSLDVESKELFHAFALNYELTEQPPKWMYSYTFYPWKSGFDCCSNLSISFHYVSPKQMRVLEFSLYHLRAFGYRGETLSLHSAYRHNSSTDTPTAPEYLTSIAVKNELNDSSSADKNS